MNDCVVPLETLRIVFDVAVNSMDFGSDFLCEEDVVALREIARIIGVDPMVATPRSMRCRYNGEHRWIPQRQSELRSGMTHHCFACKAWK